MQRLGAEIVDGTGRRIAPLVASVLLALAFALPAGAATRLFALELTTQSNLTVGFSATYPSTTGVAIGNAFTVPADVLVSYTMQTITAPGFRSFYQTLMRENLTGSFYAGVLTPSLTTTVYANTTMYPNIYPTFVRIGLIRMIAGPNGFGGVMPLSFNDVTMYSRVVYPNPIYYAVNRTVMHYRGIGPLGKSDSNAAAGMRTTTNQGYTAFTRWAATTGPWITGSVTAADAVGAYNTAFSAVGVDNRNPAGTSGTLSVVTPTLIFDFLTDGAGTATFRKEGFVSVSTLTFTFLPEPARLVLLAGGLLGLLGLNRLPRRP